MSLTFERRTPCASCPYRVDAPRQHWHRDHFASVLRGMRDPVNGPVFACHSTAKQPVRDACVGWMLDQIARHMPSIQLRLTLIRSDPPAHYLGELHAGGAEMFDGIEDMISANFPELLEGDDR